MHSPFSLHDLIQKRIFFSDFSRGTIPAAASGLIYRECLFSLQAVIYLRLRQKAFFDLLLGTDAVFRGSELEVSEKPGALQHVQGVNATWQHLRQYRHRLNTGLNIPF